MESNNKEEQETVRVFMDGAFDVMHYGHMNAFRLGRSLGTHLIVGVNSDESITACKGPPLMNNEERLTMVQSCKFVNQVIPECPYVMTPEYLNYLFDQHRVDLVVHGDDPCIVDGKDVYASAKATGRYRSIPRTEGISTTDLVGRILSLSDQEETSTTTTEPTTTTTTTAALKPRYLGQRSQFLTTGNVLRQFGAGEKPCKPGMEIVYIDGAWDLFNCGHVAMLKAAKEHGDYLIAGVLGDATVNRVQGGQFPLQSLQERVLSILGCRYVDDVLMDAPYEIPTHLVERLGVSKVVVFDTNRHDLGGGASDKDRFRHAQSLNVLLPLESPSSFDPRTIVQRIHENHHQFQAKFERKMKAEHAYYAEKYSKTKS